MTLDERIHIVSKYSWELLGEVPMATGRGSCRVVCYGWPLDGCAGGVVFAPGSLGLVFGNSIAPHSSVFLYQVSVCIGGKGLFKSDIHI